MIYLITYICGLLALSYLAYWMEDKPELDMDDQMVLMMSVVSWLWPITLTIGVCIFVIKIATEEIKRNKE